MKNKKEKTLKDWTPEEKLDAIIKTASMTEHERGEYLRSHGLYSANLEQWKKDCTNGLQSDLGRPKKDPEVFKLMASNHRLLIILSSLVTYQLKAYASLAKAHDINGGN